MKAITRLGPAWLALLLLLALPAAGQDKDRKDDKKAPDKKPPEKKDVEKKKAPDAKPAEKKAATLVIRLPADARLEIDGQLMLGTGDSERTFKTPPVEPGKRYYYIVRARWEPNNYTFISRARKVYVRAGETTEVDLRKADPKQPDDIFVRYIATPMPVVEAMLKLAKVGKDDVVYDLGCGDGRIVVTAVSKYGASKGVGVDIDPERIKDSQRTAKQAGVTEKVDFRREDVLKVKDLDKATVVCLYLGDDLNVQLRPILQKVLKPGTRVVSHRFTMGDWKPDKTDTVKIGPAEYKLHLWMIKKEDKKEAAKKEKKEIEKKEPQKKEPEKKEKPKEKEEGEKEKKEPEKKKDGKKEKDKEEGKEKEGQSGGP
jgi:uncharacterized protein (TIGR03000 family)